MNQCVAKLPRQALPHFQAASGDRLSLVFVNVKRSTEQSFSSCSAVSVEKEVGGWFQYLLVLPGN